MKYYKFEKIKKGENPIIRVTFKKWFGDFVIRDICKHGNINGFWIFMDNGELIINCDPINTFHKNDDDIYYINGNNYGKYN